MDDNKRAKMIIDKRRFTMEDDNYIPPFTGRPVRDQAIGKDDLINIQIALNTTKTVNELMGVI